MPHPGPFLPPHIAQWPFGPLNELYPLLRLVAALVVVASTIPAYAQPRLNCADWRLNRDGSWQPRRQVTMSPEEIAAPGSRGRLWATLRESQREHMWLAASRFVDRAPKIESATARHLVFCRKRFFAKALPEPDLKYRSGLRALAPSSTATYERRIAGRYLHVEVTQPCR